MATPRESAPDILAITENATVAEGNKQKKKKKIKKSYKKYEFFRLHRAVLELEEDEVLSDDNMEDEDMELLQKKNNLRLFKAVWVGNLNLVKCILRKSSNIINLQDAHKRTAFMAAAMKGELKICEYLLQNGAQINCRCSTGETALTFAVRKGNLAITNLLVTNGANINVMDGIGRTPLMWGCAYGFTDLVRLLWQKGADVNEQDRSGDTPLNIAIENNQVELAEFLIVVAHANINRQNLEGRSPLALACLQGMLKTVKLLLHYGADAQYKDMHGMTPYLLAARHGHCRILEELLKLLGDHVINDPDERGASAIILATKEKHSAMVMLLLDKTGIDVDHQDGHGNTALMAASMQGKADMVTLLVNANAKLDLQSHKGNTALMWSCYRGHLPLVRLLVLAGASLDIQDNLGNTALMFATSNDKAEVAAFLISRSCNFRLEDAMGQNAWQLARAETKTAIRKYVNTIRQLSDPDNKHAALAFHPPATPAIEEEVDSDE